MGAPRRERPQRNPMASLIKMREQFKPSEAASNPGEHCTSCCRIYPHCRPFRSPHPPALRSQALSSPPQPAPTSEAELSCRITWGIFFNGFIEVHLHTIKFICFKCTLMICSKFTELYSHRRDPVLEYFHPPKSIPPNLGDFDAVILGQTCEYVLEQVPGAFWDCGGVWGPTKSKPWLEGSFQRATPGKDAVLLKPSPWLREKCVRWSGDKSVVIRHIYWFLLQAPLWALYRFSLF